MRIALRWASIGGLAALAAWLAFGVFAMARTFLSLPRPVSLEWSGEIRTTCPSECASVIGVFALLHVGLFLAGAATAALALVRWRPALAGIAAGLVAFGALNAALEMMVSDARHGLRTPPLMLVEAAAVQVLVLTILAAPIWLRAVSGSRPTAHST